MNIAANKKNVCRRFQLPPRSLHAALVALGVLYASAASSETLTADQLIELVRTANSSVVSARLGEKEAAGRVKTARGALLPTVSMDAKGTWFANPSEAVTLNAGSFGSIPIPTPANPTLLPSTDVTLLDAQDPFYYQAAFSFDQALWTWGKLDAAVKTREAELLAARTSGDRVEALALADVWRALYDLVFQREAFSLVEAQRDLSARMLASVAASRDAGAVTSLEYEEAVLNAENLERSAESLADSIAKLERSIVLMAGLDPAGSYTVSTAGLDLTADTGPSREDTPQWTQRARSGNLDLLLASRTVDLRNCAAELARRQAAGKPDVGLNLRGGWNGSRLPGETDWDESGDWFVTASVAIKGTLLDFGVSSGKIQEASAAAERSASDFSWAASQVETAVENALASLHTLSRDVEYRERVAAFRASKVLDAESRLEAGAGTELSVMNAQSEHLSAVLDLAEARMHYTDAWVSFLLLAAPAEFAKL